MQMNWKYLELVTWRIKGTSIVWLCALSSNYKCKYANGHIVDKITRSITRLKVQKRVNRLKYANSLGKHKPKVDQREQCHRICKFWTGVSTPDEMQMSLTSREMLIKNLFENIKKKNRWFHVDRWRERRRDRHQSAASGLVPSRFGR